MIANKLTLAQAAKSVKLKAEQIDARPDGLMEEPAGWNGTHWKLTLRRTRVRPCQAVGYAHGPDVRDRRTWTVYWSQGSGCGDTPPAVADVLEALWLDVQGIDAYPELAFDAWCREHDYDPDSRKAEKVYKACVKAARAWGRFWDGVDITSGDET